MLANGLQTAKGKERDQDHLVIVIHFLAEYEENTVIDNGRVS